jgi:hypothetical protein
MGMIESEILAVGDDAFRSQYETIFPSGIPGGGNSLRLSLRQKGTFDPPEHGVVTYEVIKKGQKVVKPGGAEEVDKMFMLTIRVDQEYGVYDDLYNWKQLVYNEDTGSPGRASQFRTTMLVRNLNENNIPTATFKFTGVFLQKIKVTEYDHESGEPVEIEATFYFVRMKKE